MQPSSNAILKSFLAKSGKHGEGSHGGHIIGHTRGGKPIYERHKAGHPTYASFTAADHHAASRFHREQAGNYLGKAEMLGEDIAAGSHDDDTPKELDNLHQEIDSLTDKGNFHYNTGKEHAQESQKLQDQGQDLFEHSGKGEIIGRTQSGKDVREAGSKKDYGYGRFKFAHKDFTTQDHLDAAALHRKNKPEPGFHERSFGTSESLRDKVARQHEYFAAHPEHIKRKKPPKDSTGDDR